LECRARIFYRKGLGSMQLKYHLIDGWPPLAWLARCPVSSCTVDVFHGSQVETKSSWFCEAVWDGPFSLGDFDNTDIIFGSGGRIREDEVNFVSSGTTVDRLQAVKHEDSMLVSNSLVCLAKATDASVDYTYHRYFGDFETICEGLKDYKRWIKTSVGNMYFCYFNNFRWDRKNLVEVEKANPVRDFSSFANYRGFLETSLVTLAKNLSSEDRRFQYQLSATLSSGYDTSAIVALAKTCNLQEAISIKKARSGLPDDGSEIADILGLKVIYVDRDGWKSQPFSEVPFIASDVKGEDVYLSGARDRLKGRVLLTGYAAGGFWLNDSYLLNPHLMRRDQSGLSLTEFRLWEGFIHMPLAFIGAKQIEDIYAIAVSGEMAPWDIGGDYNRPIQRRIVEESGIPRECFAVEKKAASVLLFQQKSFLSPNSLDDYLKWLDGHSDLWWSKEDIPPIIMRRLWSIWIPFMTLFSLVMRILTRMTPPGLFRKILQPLNERVRIVARNEYLFRFLFPWAFEKAKNRYAGGPLFQQNSREDSKLPSSPPRIHLNC